MRKSVTVSEMGVSEWVGAWCVSLLARRAGGRAGEAPTGVADTELAGKRACRSFQGGRPERAVGCRAGLCKADPGPAGGSKNTGPTPSARWDAAERASWDAVPGL